jgi:ABC-type polysaccharide/polyol phosphate export permease
MRAFLDATQRDLFSAFKVWPLWTMLGWNDIRQRYRRSTLGPFLSGNGSGVAATN